MTNWQFEKTRPRTKRRDPAWAEFFHSASSIADNCVALVRESLQNSLDAATDTAATVTVRFGLAGPRSALPAERFDPYFSGLFDHVRGSDLAGPDENKGCEFLVVEDFGTKGLLGDTASSQEPSAEESNDFYYFFRHEGKSGKQQGQRGRWGIGRFVFPMSSQVFSIFALTVRQESAGPVESLLMGNAVLRVHEVDGVTFDPDGYWGVDLGADEPIQPIADADTVATFTGDFRLMRQGEPGLSVVVPYLERGWKAEDLVFAVLRDYFVPIASGKLRVIVDDLDAEKSTTIDNSNLRKVVETLPERSQQALLRDIRLVSWASDATAYSVTTTYDGSSKPKWGDNLTIDSATLEDMRAEYERDGTVLVNVPVTVRQDDGKSEDSFVQVAISSAPDERQPAMFVRSGIIVSEAGGRAILSDARAIVLIDDAAASQMFGDAEGPAHVNWSDQTKAFKKRYEYGSSWLSVVRSSPVEILKRLRGLDGRQDDLIAAEYFPLPDPGPLGQSSGKPRSKRETPRPGLGREVLAYERTPSGDVTVRLNRTGLKRPPQQVLLRCAYDATGVNALKSWENEDFALVSTSSGVPGEVVATIQGGNATIDGNRVTADLTHPPEFEVSFSGFDAHRDVVFEAEVQE